MVIAKVALTVVCWVMLGVALKVAAVGCEVRYLEGYEVGCMLGE